MKKALAFVLALVILLTSQAIPLFAATVQTPGTGEGQYATLEDAIASASDGDVIEIVGPVKVSSTITLTKNLTFLGADKIINNVDPEGTGPVFRVENSLAITIDKSVRWKDLFTSSGQYPVEFTDSYTSYLCVYYVEENDSVTQPTIPDRTGYQFIGWRTGSPEGPKYDFNAPVTGSFTLYAGWQYVTPTSYTVTFDSDGGSAVAQQVITPGNKASRPADPTKSGYTFVNWHDGSASGAVWDFDTVITENKTLVAEWNAYVTPTNYTVSFETYGGSSVAAQDVAPGGKATRPSPDPTRSGFDFENWYKDSGCTALWDFDTETVTADTTIYAKWTPVATVTNYTVAFETNGGTAVANQSVASGTNAVRPADPKKTGYVFAGWFADAGLGVSFDFAKAITADTTVYAKWTVCDHSKDNKATYTVDVAPSCTKAGKRTITCSVCGATYSETMSMTEHNFVNGVCSVCGEHKVKGENVRNLSLYCEEKKLTADVINGTELASYAGSSSAADALAKIKAALLAKAGMSESDKYYRMLDVSVLYRYREGGTYKYQKIHANNFPADGLEVKLTYDDLDMKYNRDYRYDFEVYHMIGETYGDRKAGDIERCSVRKTSDGIIITMKSFSPIIISWERELIHSHHSYDGKDVIYIKDRTEKLDPAKPSENKNNNNNKNVPVKDNTSKLEPAVPEKQEEPPVQEEVPVEEDDSKKAEILPHDPGNNTPGTEKQEEQQKGLFNLPNIPAAIWIALALLVISGITIIALIILRNRDKEKSYAY